MNLKKEIMQKRLLHIKLPKNKKLKDQLVLKLEEYRTRLHNPNMYYDSLAKSELLSSLLLSDVLNTLMYWKDFKKAYPKIDAYYFLNACMVIDAYVNNDSDLLYGGTGLAKIS